MTLYRYTTALQLSHADAVQYFLIVGLNNCGK